MEVEGGMPLNVYSAQNGPPKIHLALNVTDAEVRKPCPEVVGTVRGHPQGAKEAQSGPSTQSGVERVRGSSVCCRQESARSVVSR